MEGKCLMVFFADYPDVRIFLRRGRFIVNMAAEPGGKVLVLEG